MREVVRRHENAHRWTTASMSVCIVAQYPWSAVRDLADGEPAGAVMCSDTRLTSSQKIRYPFWSKQEPIGRNIVVCFTSSNAAATVRGLGAVKGSWSLRRVGESLLKVHQRYGGCTELLAVVTRREQAPSILELMPPAYKPRPRRGIVGIGDFAVLSWFHRNFPEYGPAELRSQLEPEVLEKIANAFGGQYPCKQPSLPIEYAVLHIAAVFSEAIRRAGGPTVSLPVQVMTVSRGESRSMDINSTEDFETWEPLTVERAKVRLVRPNPPVTRHAGSKRTASQLFV
jgi:hypothetical protein